MLCEQDIGGATIDADGISLKYFAAGAGDPIVLQKGAPESVRRAYVEAAAQLAARISVLTLQSAGAPEHTGRTP